MAILITLVILVIFTSNLMCDASSVCKNIKNGKVLAMGSVDESFFYVVDTSFRGIKVFLSPLSDQHWTMPGITKVEKTAICNLTTGTEFSLEQWASTSLKDSPFTTGFLFKNKSSKNFITMIAVISEDRRKIAANYIDPQNILTSDTFSKTAILPYLPPRTTFVTTTYRKEQKHVALYDPESGKLSQTSIGSGFQLSDSLLTESFPKELSLDGGYYDRHEMIGWSQKEGSVFLITSGGTDAVKLPFDEFFICESPEEEPGSFLLMPLTICGILFLLMIVVGAVCACKKCKGGEAEDKIKMSQQIGKSKRAKESTAGQSWSSPVNQIKLAPSIAGKLEDKKSVRKLSTSWSRASQSSSSSVSSTAGGGASTLSTASSATSKNSKLSAVSGVSGVGNASSVNSALGGSSFAGYGNSNMASAVSAAGSSSAISTATSNTSKAGMSNVGASSAISSTAASKAGSSVAGSSNATSSTAASSKAATSKPATPTNKAGTTSKALSPVSKFAASSSKGSTSPGAASKASAASSKALSPKPAAAKKATSPAGTSKQTSSKASSAADSKSNSKLK